VICSKCGEANSDTFRFCGMCGALLEARSEVRSELRPDARPETRRPAGAPVPGLPKIAETADPLRPLVIGSGVQPAARPIPSISGPSMLGLDQVALNQPSIDSLREKSFSGLDSFFEPEERPKNSGRRLLLLLVLLVALGVAGWWTYTNYLGMAAERKPQSTDSTTPASVEEVRKPAVDAPPASAGNVPPAAAPSTTVAEGPSENATPLAEPTPKTTAPISTKPATPATPKIALGDRSAQRRESRGSAVLPSKAPVQAAADTGDADFRKGEAYLYGRGMPENCDQAVKNLKAASAKSNAKARSAFGTMYATGHCVPRDLPTSYVWFAMALRADPNNQILEKDLSAVWNQMTPPERQMATRMKQ
jgi:cytoskeletal protein RodZ